LIAETIATAARKLEADLWTQAAENIRAAVDRFEMDMWELARQQLEASPTYDD